MISKAIVEEVISKTKVKVRVPIYNKYNTSATATNVNDLAEATICCPAGQSPYFVAGDVVYVAFEDDNIGTPVVVGRLYTTKPTLSTSEIDCSVLNVGSKCILSYDTSVGSVSSVALSTLSNSSDNIQNQLNNINDKLDEMNKRLDNIELYQNTHTYGCLVSSAPNSLPTKADADYILNAVANKLELKGWQKIAADVNGDGKILASDAQLVNDFIDDPIIGKYGKVGQNFVYTEGN